MTLEDLKVYSMAMEIGEKVWIIVERRDYFQRDTVGKQLVKAVDSIAANLSEGYERYHYRESKNFSYYSRGSLFETKTWIVKAHNRGLTNKQEFTTLTDELTIVGKMLNRYIKSIGDEKIAD